jgi:6-phosphogluconolactonase (cycloisomerase 2 family)
VRILVTFIGIMFLGICASVSALGASKTQYVITNDDVPPDASSGATFYAVGSNGLLTMKAEVLTGRGGIAGGYFGSNRVAVLPKGSGACVYVSQASGGNIVWIKFPNLKIGGSVTGSKHDTGKSDGVGLAVNSQYLYASFTDFSTIGTFQMEPDCKLDFVGDIDVSGLESGTIDGMAIHGKMMVVTYGDGSVESFDISDGVPKSNGDEQNSTGYMRGGNTYPSGVDITQDGHYAIFGDTTVSTVVEVSDISSGKLKPTVVYHLGSAINSSNVLLSPDETLLYISNNQSGKVTAAFFDKDTGKLTKGCVSGVLKGYVTDWSYTAGLSLAQTTGTGRFVYVAEFGSPSSIAEVKVTSAGGKCSLKELPKSPAADPNSPGLLSIGTFPPQPF